jgi:hypothetical protein
MAGKERASATVNSVNCEAVSRGRQTVQGFALRAQWLPAGRQKVHLWPALEGLLRHFRGCLSDMFAGVDHQQHLSASQEGGKRGIRIL